MESTLDNEIETSNSEESAAKCESGVTAKRSELAVGSMAGFMEAAEAVSTEKEAAEIMCALGHTPGLTELGIAPDVLVKLLPDEGVVVLPRVQRIGGTWAYRALKRVFDIVSCSVALVLLVVPMSVVALKIKSESPGPVIYAQRRTGKGGKVFKLYKFRSMYIDAEVRGAQWAQEGDPRVTPFGRFMRDTRLDEIPQFWNVVKGDMSLIGPRPERPAFCEEFEKRLPGWGQRTLVKPGISGLAQVSGGYDLLPREKALYDFEYIENRSVAMDARIILKTVGTVFAHTGAR